MAVDKETPPRPAHILDKLNDLQEEAGNFFGRAVIEPERCVFKDFFLLKVVWMNMWRAIQDVCDLVLLQHILVGCDYSPTDEKIRQHFAASLPKRVAK
jgi:hypothetical protein